MATKNQREFKKQMKQLEKEGKVPDSYYARRKFKYTGGVSVLLVLFILYRMGFLHLIMLSFIGPAIVHEAEQYENNLDLIAPYDYSKASQEIDILFNDLCIDIYGKFDEKDIPLSKFEDYDMKIENLIENTQTDNEAFKELEKKYLEILDICKEANSFIIKNYDNSFSETDKNYFNALVKKYYNLYYESDQIYRDIMSHLDYTGGE